ncbi:DUF4087 domain-containing protein [Roseibium algae]
MISRTFLNLTFVSVFLGGLVTQVAQAAENRCGLIENPTPANWWLTDGEGTWTIRLQGRDWEPLGMDRIGDISEGDYRRTNGNYGYACACAKVDTTTFDGERYITAIHSFTQIPLARCDNDPALAKEAGSLTQNRSETGLN